jgi:hypothetical protein
MNLSAMPIQQIERTCLDCSSPAAPGKYSRYCLPCRFAHRRKQKKYEATPEIVEYLKKFYKGSPRERGRATRILARERNLPRWWVVRTAQKLGLGYPMKRKNWNAKEIEWLEEHIGELSAERLAAHLGRSVNSVVLKIKRLHLSRRVRRGWFNMRDMEKGFGEGHRRIYEWIRRGWLHAERDTRIAGSSGMPFWKFTVDAVREFIWNHPTEFDLKKADQAWFLLLVEMCSEKGVCRAD